MGWPTRFCAARLPQTCQLAATGDDDPEHGPLCNGCRRRLDRLRAVTRKRP